VVGAYFKELGLNDKAIYFLTMAPLDMMIYLTQESAERYSIAHDGELPSKATIQLLMQSAMNNKSRQAPEPQPAADKDSNGLPTRVTQNVNLRKDASPYSANLLKGLEVDYIPAGSEIVFPKDKDVSCMRNRATDTIWCPLNWTTGGHIYKGWVRAYFLELRSGNRVGCLTKPNKDYACSQRKVS
jgi:hypothetical protein